MIFSINYRSANKLTAQEIRCPYNQLGLIFDFIKENPQKRVNIIIKDDINETELTRALEQIEYIREVAKDYTIECGHVKVLYTLISKGYKTYLRFPVSDWETFYQLIKLGVSDIYIDGPLCFNMDKIELAKGNTLIRVSPTISPNASLTERDVTSFFIRPEDLELYKNMIDVIDFHELEQEKEDALYSIYNRRSFNYKLNDLIKGLNEDMNNLLIQSDFAKERRNCGQRCKIPGYKCNICRNYFNILRHSLNLADISY